MSKSVVLNGSMVLLTLMQSILWDKVSVRVETHGNPVKESKVVLEAPLKAIQAQDVPLNLQNKVPTLGGAGTPTPSSSSMPTSSSPQESAQTWKREVSLSSAKEVNFISQIGDGSLADPLFLFSAKNTASEVSEPILVLVPGTRGPAQQLVYPGRITDPKKGHERVFEARAFYGYCLELPAHGFFPTRALYVSFQTEKIDRKPRPQFSILAIAANPATNDSGSATHEKLIELPRAPSIKFTERQVKQGKCKEIPPIHRTILAKALDLTPRKGNDDKEIESEDDSEVEVEKSGT